MKPYFGWVPARQWGQLWVGTTVNSCLGSPRRLALLSSSTWVGRVMDAAFGWFVALVCSEVAHKQKVHTALLDNLEPAVAQYNCIGRSGARCTGTTSCPLVLALAGAAPWPGGPAHYLGRSCLPRYLVGVSFQLLLM